MKINDFSKGLSTRLDPTLIKSNEAIIFDDINNTEQTLKSIQDNTVSTTAIEQWFYSFNDVWYSDTIERDYVEYNGKLYFTVEGDVPKKIVNGQEKLLGIDKPGSILVTTDGGAGSISTSAETLQYTYTYYDSSEGVESEPVAYSEELSLGANKQVDIIEFTPSINPSVDLIRLYRIGAGATQFTLLIELPANTTIYTDNIQTINAIGYLLDTIDKQAPLSGLTNLAEAYGILFASIGSKLYYSSTGEPDYFPSLNTINIYRPITGILPIQDGILVFTASTVDLIVGKNPANFSKVNINAKEYGCNSHKSCKVVKQTPVWSSSDGICTYSSGIISVITKDKLGKQTFDVVNTALYDEQYIICLSDGSLHVMDMRFGISFKSYTKSIVSNVGVFDGILYAVIDGFVATLFTGELIYLNYLSGELTEGDATNSKMYNNIYIRSIGRFRIKIIIDGDTIASETIDGDKVFEMKVPQEKQRGYSIQFSIYGIGIIKEIEYKVLGRQNGR